MYTKTVRIDVTPGGEPKVIHISQYDSASRTITFELFSENSEFTMPSGATVEISGTKPDGNGFSKLGTVSGNTVTVELTEQMAAVAGRVPCKLSITSGSKKLLTEKFVLMVDRAALDIDTLKSDSEIRQLIEIESRADDLVAAANSIDGAVETLQETAAAVAENARTASAAATEATNSKEAIDEILEDVTDKLDVLDTRAQELDAEYQRDIAGIATARTDALGNINDKTQQILDYTSKSDLVAAQALAKANNLENDVAEVLNATQTLKDALQAALALANSKVDDGYADGEGYLHLTANGEDVGTRIGPFAANGSGGGGGGGTSGNNATMSMTNNTGWMTKTIASGDECPVSITWSSIEEELETGPGALQISVGGIIRATLQVSQGYVVADVSPYLSAGSNSVDVRITDVYGNSRHIMFTVTVIALSLSSTFDTSQTYDSVIQFPYTPIGAVNKTVHFILDGKEIGTQVTAVSGRQMTYTIPAQSHGGHSLRVYFEAEINYQMVQSNELYFEFTCVEALGTDPVITSSYSQTTVKQYTSITIPFTVYNPSSLTAEVKIYANDALVSTQTVDRKEHTYTYKANTAGELHIKLTSGTAVKTIDITVTESDVEIEAETENLALHLTAQGRSNNEEHPEVWTSDVGEVEASLTGFNFASDGWQTDDDGNVCLRVSGNARVNIPYRLFEADARQAGLTFEVEYATRNAADYNAVILSCMSGGRGLEITPQTAVLKSEQTELSMQYKEGEHIRIAYTIDKRAEDRLVRSFIEGKPARATQYPDDDDFSQVNPVGISIGSNGCGIDIYCIRVYTNNLTIHQMLENWIADAQDGTLMLERYTRNQVYDEYGNVVISQLPSNLPYFILEAEELPQYKGDKKTISGSYTDPLHPAKSFTFTGCQINVQGTSSAPYYRKNYDMQFKGGFEMTTSGHAENYKLRDTSIPTARFVLKANVASSEMANNTELVRFYNDLCPYKTPEMEEDDKVRWGIDGFPIVVFWYDVVSGTTKFLGDYDFNFPKRFPEGYGYTA